MIAAAVPFFNKLKVEIFCQASPRYEWDQNSATASWKSTRATGRVSMVENGIVCKTHQGPLTMFVQLRRFVDFWVGILIAKSTKKDRERPSLNWPTLLVQATQSLLLIGRMETQRCTKTMQNMPNGNASHHVLTNRLHPCQQGSHPVIKVRRLLRLLVQNWVAMGPFSPHH